jgi:hypothetical protein
MAGVTMDEATDFLAKIKRERRREYRRERKRIDLLMQSYWAGDVCDFRDNMTADEFPWQLAFKEFAKLTAVPRKMQSEFQFAWCDTKGHLLRARSHTILCAALHAMMPPYTGPALRLFRGTTLREHERHEYGLAGQLANHVGPFV